MFSLVGIKWFESALLDDGAFIGGYVLYVAYVGGIIFFARDNFPYFTARIFNRSGSFEAPADVARYER